MGDSAKGGKQKAVSSGQELLLEILPALLWELQEPFVLLSDDRSCLGVSQGFVGTFCKQLPGEEEVVNQFLLSELWPGHKDVELDKGESTTHVHFNGETKAVEVKCTPISSELFLFSFVSPDEAESFFHQQRLQTLGLLAGGVAHDFNNILAGILGHITFLQAVLPAEGAHCESLEAITGGAKKASTLTKQILDFSKFDLQEENPAVDVVELVNSTAPLLRGALTSTVELTLDLPKESQVVKGSEGKLAQVLVNLVINARDAVEQDGKVTVRVRGARKNDDPLSLLLDRENQLSHFVVLEVQDNGVGMSEQVRARALEPYFSTKGEHGTGLGLATVASITEAHGGLVHINSQTGDGTCVQVFLKRADADQLAGMHSAGREQIELPTGTERVLVVDDEKAVRNVVAMSLRHLGYTVEEKSDPREARELLQDLSNEYDLVVLDMLMPHISGDELFFELRSFRPDLPVLIMSGYSEEGAIQRVLAEPGTNFIHKPFTVEELSVNVRESIDLNTKEEL